MKFINNSNLKTISGGICATISLDKATGKITYSGCTGIKVIAPDSPKYSQYYDWYINGRTRTEDGTVIYC